MPWTCFVVKDINEAEDRPGAMWPSYNEVDNRTDWYITLPGGGFHNLHAGAAKGTGWQITGEAPKFTVTPSIRCYEVRKQDGTLYRQGWHGYLTDGVLTDDYEGRTYDEVHIH